MDNQPHYTNNTMIKILYASYKIDYGYNVKRIKDQLIGIFDDEDILLECLDYYNNNNYIKEFQYTINEFYLNKYIK